MHQYLLHGLGQRSQHCLRLCGCTAPKTPRALLPPCVPQITNRAFHFSTSCKQVIVTALCCPLIQVVWGRDRSVMLPTKGAVALGSFSMTPVFPGLPLSLIWKRLCIGDHGFVSNDCHLMLRQLWDWARPRHYSGSSLYKWCLAKGRCAWEWSVFKATTSLQNTDRSRESRLRG
jgi:hypothetical protein